MNECIKKKKRSLVRAVSDACESGGELGGVERLSSFTLIEDS